MRNHLAFASFPGSFPFCPLPLQLGTVPKLRAMPPAKTRDGPVVVAPLPGVRAPHRVVARARAPLLLLAAKRNVDGEFSG